jgi:hypothetical protein
MAQSIWYALTSLFRELLFNATPLDFSIGSICLSLDIHFHPFDHAP